MSNPIPNNIPIIMKMAPAIEAFHQTAKYYPSIQRKNANDTCQIEQK
jgi:hypothetical protein